MHEATFDVEAAIENRLASVSEQERERWKRFQDEQRAKLNVGDGRSLLGVRQVELALKELENGESDFEYTRLAEGYALQGNFLLAYDLTRDPLKRSEYKEILDATNMDCPCPPQFKFIKDKYPEFSLQSCTRCGTFRRC